MTELGAGGRAGILGRGMQNAEWMHMHILIYGCADRQRRDAVK